MKRIWNTVREWKWLTILAVLWLALGMVAVWSGDTLLGIFYAIVALVLVEVDRD